MRNSGDINTRAAREENKKTREIRVENQKLRRENARLRKELDRRIEGLPSPSVKLKNKATKTVVSVSACKFCSSQDLKFMDTPSGKRLTVCGDCNKQYTEPKTKRSGDGIRD